jgi:hypothetical protein
MMQLAIAMGMGGLVFGFMVGYIFCWVIESERIEKLIEDLYEQDCEIALLRNRLYGKPKKDEVA